MFFVKFTKVGVTLAVTQNVGQTKQLGKHKQGNHKGLPLQKNNDKNISNRNLNNNVVRK